MWLGLDDTDSLAGGCTTQVFDQLLRALPCEFGEPRLVRLWPFAPRRTRGNAALAVELFCDDSIIPWLDTYWTKNILPLSGEVSKSYHSDREQFPADPGMVLFENQPEEELYWSTVRGEMDVNPNLGHQWGGKGRIGAIAACAWPANNVTWEGIAWRIGQRKVCPEALERVDHLDGTFLCRDPRTNQGLIAPRGPCPVMFGVRAITPEIALDATKSLINAKDTADVSGYRIFATNQASGDHITQTHITAITSNTMLKGGHVILNDKLLCFSESGDMNLLCQWLKVSDEIEYFGMEFAGQIHLEGLKLISSTEFERPICQCGTRMKSMGSQQGIRCPKCKLTGDDNWLESPRTPLFKGWVQPPVDKRRHLARQF